MPSERTLERAMQDARSGRLAEAITAVRTVLRVQPRNADALQMLGLFLTQDGQQQQAVTHLERAVAIAPQVAGYRNNLGNALMAAARNHDALMQFRAAIELDPSYARAHLGMALALMALHDSDAAHAACMSGLAIRPDWPEMAISAGAALEAGDRMDEAVEFLRGQVARHPTHRGLRTRYLFALNYPSIPADEVAAAHRGYRDAIVRAAPEPAGRDPDPVRPLRIGVLSGDLRTHSVGFFAEPVFRTKPEGDTITCFATDPRESGDPMTRRFMDASDGWVECALMDDAALDRAIRERGIDVLVELSGHSSGGRLTALDRKPAPVIVTAIGYPNTTGHPAVDVRIVDSTTDPPGSEAACTERLARIDPCFLCYRPPAGAPEPMLPAADAPITFGSFNLTSKAVPATLALWAGAMHAVPGSRLLVKSLSMVDAATRARLLARFAAAGIDGTRVDIVPFAKTVEEHLALYGRVHVALDTTPYNGTTTTCEALWMGVPVVTVAGDRHAARVGASVLAAAGLPGLVARDADSYVRIAAGLAGDRARLETLRTGLRPTLRSSALMDEAAYGARFHGALREAWSNWCGRARAGGE
jgi:predicted O-linked N-acetylglucosamine transferase (SPINDLY family)